MKDVHVTSQALLYLVQLGFRREAGEVVFRRETQEVILGREPREVVLGRKTREVVLGRESWQNLLHSRKPTIEIFEMLLNHDVVHSAFLQGSESGA
jgi:hypothetical protein